MEHLTGFTHLITMNTNRIEAQVTAKMFRDKRFRTKVVPNKRKEHKNERFKKGARRRWEFGVQFEPWET